MSDKYYTPKLEELHVGLDLETKSGSHWYPFTIEDAHELYSSWKDHDKEHHPIRVKHLDREDIESFGLKQSGMTDNLFLSGFIENKKLPILGVDTYYYGLNHQGENTYGIFIKSDQVKFESNVFYGTIKNKSELKRILKQVGYVD